MLWQLFRIWPVQCCCSLWRPLMLRIMSLDAQTYISYHTCGTIAKHTVTLKCSRRHIIHNVLFIIEAERQRDTRTTSRKQHHNAWSTKLKRAPASIVRWLNSTMMRIVSMVRVFRNVNHEACVLFCLFGFCSSFTWFLKPAHANFSLGVRRRRRRSRSTGTKSESDRHDRRVSIERQRVWVAYLNHHQVARELIDTHHNLT